MLLVLPAVLSALIGTPVPLAKEIIRALQRSHKSDQFFSTRLGKALLDAFGLAATTETPNQLFAELSETSEKLDRIVARIQDFTKVRESAVSELEAKLVELSAQEGKLRTTIEQLENIPLPAAERFAEMVKKEEREAHCVTMCCLRQVYL